MKNKISMTILCMVVFGLSACTPKLPDRINNGEWYWNMSNIITSYDRIYLQCPQNADELIKYLELNDGFLVTSEGWLQQYEFLKRYHHRIILLTQIEEYCVTNIKMYIDKVKDSEKYFVVMAEHTDWCEKERGLNGEIRFYKHNREPIIGQLYENYKKELRIRLSYILYKSPTIQWRNDSNNIFNDNLYDITIIEYNENRLIDLCSNHSISLQSSQYYQDLYNCLRKFCAEYNLGRIVLDSYIPK